MFRAVVAEEESSKTRRTRRMKSASSSFSSVIIFYVIVVTVFVSLGVFVDGREFEHRRASFGRGSSLETTIQRILVENLMGAGYHVLFSGETIFSSLFFT